MPKLRLPLLALFCFLSVSGCAFNSGFYCDNIPATGKDAALYSQRFPGHTWRVAERIRHNLEAPLPFPGSVMFRGLPMPGPIYKVELRLVRSDGLNYQTLIIPSWSSGFGEWRKLRQGDLVKFRRLESPRSDGHNVASYLSPELIGKEGA